MSIGDAWLDLAQYNRATACYKYLENKMRLDRPKVLSREGWKLLAHADY